MKIRTNIYLITATLLTQYALITKCADVSDSNTGPSAYTIEPFDHFDHLDHLDHDDHESLERFLTGSLQSSDDSGKTNLNSNNKIIHSVKVIRHDGDSITKYVTTSHTNPDANNTPGAYTKITKKTIIKQQSNSDENSVKGVPSGVTQNIYSKNNSKEIETGNSVSKSQTMSQIDHTTNNGVSLTSSRPITNTPDNLQNGMRTTTTKIITSGNTANGLNGFASGKNNVDSTSSNKAISTMSTSNTNSNYNDMVTDSSQITPPGGDVKIQTTTTETINGFTDADNQGEFRKRPEDGSFRRTKTTVVKQQNSNGRDNNFGEPDERDVEYVYEITPSRYNQLTTTSTTNAINRNVPSNDGVSTMSSSNSNSNEHNIEFDKGNTKFSKNILSQTNPSSLTTTSITNAVDEKTTDGDNFVAGDLSGKPNNRLDKAMSVGNSVYGISSQTHSDEIGMPSTDTKKNSNNADSFRQAQTKIMGYRRGTNDESHTGGSNDYTIIKLNTDDETSSLNNNANSNYMGSSHNANSMVGNPNMMAMDDDGSMAGGYSSSMTSMGNNIKGNGYYVRRKKYNRRKHGKRGNKNKIRNRGKRANKITVKSSSYGIGGDSRRSIARKNKNAKVYKSQDYVQTSPESFPESHIGNPTMQQRRGLQCSCENINKLNKIYDDSSENDNKMNDAPMQGLLDQISFGPPPYGRPQPRGRPHPRGPPPHGRPPYGRPPWLRRPPHGPPFGLQQSEFMNMNRPPGLLPGQSPTYNSQQDQAAILNGQTKTMYGQQNKFSNKISNVPQSQYLRPPNQSEPLEPPSPSGLPGQQINSFDSTQAYESNRIPYQQSFDRYQIQPPHASSSYQQHNDIIDGADDDFHHVYNEAVSPSPSELTGTRSEPAERIINVNSVGFTQTRWNRDNGNIGFEQAGTPSRSVSMTTSTTPSDNVISNTNCNRANTVYTKTVKTTKKMNGNNPPDIDVVRTESNYIY